jgi:Flp pilus assembly protein CpaB
MKPKTMILMGLAITCGLGASYMTSRLLADRSTNDEPETVEILVAKRNLSVHQRITNPDELFVKKAVKKDEVPDGAILANDFESLRGKTLKQGRNKDDHVTLLNFYDRGGLEIPHGHQAVGVRVNVETTASGLASLPGSHVNLLLTIGAQDVSATKTLVLLESVLVLAADIRVTPEGEIAAPAQVVTFALKDEDALIVTTAKQMGQITLVLRNKGDDTTAKIRGISGREILNRNKPNDPPPPPVQVVEKPKEIEKPAPPPVVEPKVIAGFYDIVNGSETGPREVTRVHYRQYEDGTISIDHTELLDATRNRQQQQPSSAPPADSKKGGRPQDF